MKKWKRYLLLITVTVLGAMCLLFAACGDQAKLRFETNGGDPIESVEVTIGEDYTLPTPVREGYSFEGWFLDKDLTGSAVGGTYRAEANVTFYAKWEQMFEIKLNLDGGTLDAPKLYLKEGENVYRFMQSYVPVKSGFEFGAWFVGDTQLSENTVMTSAGIELTARYKVGYTVEVYEQKLGGDGYEKAENVTGYEYAGADFTPTVERKGFSVVDKSDSVKTKRLSEHASENVFRLYFDRNSYTIVFFANFPEGESRTEERSYIFGETVELPTDLFTLEGYCLVGWATNIAGSVAYPVNVLEALCYNGGEPVEAPSITVEDNTNLYAVWNKGYRDLFGGGDYLYLLDENSEVIYLVRGGKYFKGEYTAKSGSFYFEDEDENILMEGKINSDGTFMYYSEVRESSSYTHYVPGRGVDESTTVYLDQYNGIEYSVKRAQLSSESEGTYVIDEDGNYVATFTTGELTGQTLTIRFDSVTDVSSDVSRAVFLVRNDEELGWGPLLRFAVSTADSGETGLAYFISAYTMTLDGFTTAVYNTGTAEYEYSYYKAEDGTYYLSSGSGERVSIRIMNENGRMGYMLYESALNHTFTGAGGELTLDGLCRVTYQEEGGTVEGFYTYEDSVFGGTLVRFTTGGKGYTFRLTSETETSDDEIVHHYNYEALGAEYAEYYYTAGNTVYASLITVRTGATTADLYVYNAEHVYVKAATGTCIYNPETDRYLVTLTEHFETGEATVPVDLSTLTAFTFGLGTVRATSSVSGASTTYAITYWCSVTAGGEATDYEQKYTSELGETLSLVNGFAVYVAADGTVSSGVCSTSSSTGITTITVVGGDAIYVELDEGNKQFIRLTGIIGEVAFRNADGTASELSMRFDGKGGAYYIAEDGTETYGKVTVSEEPGALGTQVSHFEAEGLSFDFIVLRTESGSNYVSRYNETYNGRYLSDDGELELDGFSFRATFLNIKGVTIEGTYLITEENVVRVTAENRIYYFDLLDRSFTLRGEEYGSYLIIDNQSFKGNLVSLDGYGAAEIYTLEGEEGERHTIANTSYTYENGVCTFTYSEGNTSHTLKGSFGIILLGDTYYNAFVLAHDEVTVSYVNEDDWSVLMLDAYGGAVKYTRDGMRETGAYVLVTSTMLYYVNDAGSDACIYEYDVEKGVATPITFSIKGYYTTELESLVFSRYGFMIFNGETRYYYNVHSGRVTIYHQDAEDPEANEYGFVEEDFGTFDDVKSFEGKTYYATSGYAITFARGAEGAADYPVPVSGGNKPLGSLTFTPGGGMEFSVNGIVQIDGSNYGCTVTREYNSAGELVMYVSLPVNNGFGEFRCYISVNYTGEEGSASYSVTAMRYYLSAPSQYYLNLYLLFAQLGVTLRNTFGIVYVGQVYGADGTPTGGLTADGVFGSYSGMIDANGELIASFEDAECVQLESGVYDAKFTCTDGFTYHMYFALDSSYGIPAYILVGLAREEEVKTEDGYTLKAQRIVSSETSSSAYWEVKLFKDDAEIKSDLVITRGGKLYFITRERGEDDRITKTVYYEVTLTENGEGEATGDRLPTLASMTVETRDVQTCYADDGSYVDVLDGEVWLIALKTEAEGDDAAVSYTILLAQSCEYDEAAGTYTVVVNTGATYTVKIDGNKATITEVAAEEAE